MTREFIKELLKIINKYYKCYYIEASKQGNFPYLVVPDINISKLDNVYSCFVDIEIYNNKLSNIKNEDIEDNLRKNLDGISYFGEKIAFRLAYESTNSIKINEQDISCRRLTFSTRIFECNN